MKNKLMQTLTIIAILSLLPIFMGQNDCQVNQAFKDLFGQLKKKITSQAPNGSTVYVTHLSFMDLNNPSNIIRSKYAELINEAVEKGMKEAANQNSQLAIDVSGHLIKDNEENFKKLVKIAFDAGMTKGEKIGKIINILMNPNSVDVIVTGQYLDNANNPMITIRPLVIVKSDRKIVTKDLQFTKEELFCKDPVSKKDVLCGGAHDQIAQAVQELLSQL